MKFAKKYFMPLFCVLIWVILFGVPALLVHLNPAPPVSGLERIHVKILRVSDQSPNLIVSIDGRAAVGFRFPSPIYGIFSKRTSVYLLSAQEKMRLAGCDADLYGADIKYLWVDSFRVWKVDCKAQPVGYSRIVREFNMATEQYAFAPWVGAIAMLFLIVVTFYQARMKK